MVGRVKASILLSIVTYLQRKFSKLYEYLILSHRKDVEVLGESVIIIIMIYFHNTLVQL